MNGNTQQHTDEAIIRMVLDGNTEAFGLLVNRYSPRLIGLAFNLCGDYDTALDLTQEALIAAYNSLDRLRNLASFPSWITTILRNTFRNLGRSTRLSTLSLDQLMDKGFNPPAPDCEPAFSEEDLRRVMKYVETLPEKSREALMLRYFDNMSYKEIADFLDIPLSTVTTRLNYARRQLVKKAKEGGLL